MNQRLIAALAITLGTLTAAGSASADGPGRPCTTAPESQWLTLEQLQGKLAEQGYTVSKAKLKQACGEFDVRDKDGLKLELFVDPTNGTVISTDKD